MTILRYFVLALTLPLISCGFHLRGQGNSGNAIQTIHAIELNADENIPVSLIQKIERQFELYDIDVNNKASHTLHISNSEYKQRRGASSRTSFTDRYISRYTINAHLKYQNQSWPLSISSERLFEDDRNIPTGKDREHEQINNELQEKVIGDLVNQVRGFHIPETLQTPSVTKTTAEE